MQEQLLVRGAQNIRVIIILGRLTAPSPRQLLLFFFNFSIFVKIPITLTELASDDFNKLLSINSSVFQQKHASIKV